MRGQHETGGGKRDHQDRDHRQKREVGYRRAELVAETVIKALDRADQVGDGRLTLHLLRGSGCRLQRIAGLLRHL